MPPLSLNNFMLKKEKIIQLINDYIKQNESFFIVDIKISPYNNIEILIDSFNGVTIQNCVSLSKFIESALDKDECNFSLQVSSSGLSEPFKVFEQYEKCIGSSVNVYLKEGKKILGKILNANKGKGIILETTTRKKIGNKKKQIIEQQSLSFDEIDRTKVVISF